MKKDFFQCSILRLLQSVPRERLLLELPRQRTGRAFAFSITAADNDENLSGREEAERFAKNFPINH
jgi:hypothetical protein